MEFAILSENKVLVKMQDLEVGKIYLKMPEEGQCEPIVLGELQSIYQCGYAFGGCLINGRKVPAYRVIFSNNGVLTKVIYPLNPLNPLLGKVEQNLQQNLQQNLS